MKDEGIIHRHEYPYDESETPCKAYGKERATYTDPSDPYELIKDDLDSFKAALRRGPLGIAAAVANSYSSYSSGIYTGECAGGVNHGMIVVGFGQENGMEYAIIRNSWGEWWGENGYGRMIMRPGEPRGGHCMLYSNASLPNIK